ncbi:unnamed protein product [marine sediment metagenome]|uniref:Uncharacterized protein n=1 Tax=marine sediment metagenome TaxID=412755 RepID=X0T095_9ZZZZ
MDILTKDTLSRLVHLSVEINTLPLDDFREEMGIIFENIAGMECLDEKILSELTDDLFEIKEMVNDNIDLLCEKYL